MVKTSGEWINMDDSFVNDISPTTTSYTSTSNTIGVYYTSLGYKTIQHSIAGILEDWLDISESRLEPIVSPIEDVYEGNQVQLDSPSNGITFEWIIYETDYW